jgi:3-polyprenyl-4-hydroxybenzoate decarboxylase
MVILENVKNATAGDFVRITGDIYLIIKTSPTVSADLVSVNGDPDLSALATKAELTTGLREKLGIDAYNKIPSSSVFNCVISQCKGYSCKVCC